MARALAAGLGVTALGLAAVAFGRYPGSAVIFIFFNLCFVAFVALAFPQPRLYVYIFVVLFLAMGFWAKTMVHTIWSPGFLEPVGDFRGSSEEWDRALLAMSAAALGLAAARCMHLWYRWRRSAIERASAGAPGWFVRYRGPLWILTLLSIIGVNAANLHFAFFQIGVNPKLLLPLRLHVVVAWLVNIGFAIWVAALLWWDCKAEPRTLRRNLVVPLLEGVLSAASAFSRIIYLVHAAPYALALWERWRDLNNALQRRHLWLFAGAFIVLFATAIVAVFALRLQYYPLIDRTTGARGEAHLGRSLSHELPQLIVRRWVGLEGVLTVGAVVDRGPRLLVAALTDSPKGGTESLYQRVSKLQRYLTDPTQFTFLTNAGPVAILLFSGSAAVVFAGMALIALVLILTEEVIRIWTGNPFLLAVAGAGLANVFSQTTFFYLTLIFLLQMWVAVACLAGMERFARS